jgi:anti-sigma B factor antagonist
MPIQKTIAGTECELIVRGRVDGALANDLEVEILQLAKTPLTALLINLAEANFLCSAAIRVILQHHRQWAKQGRKLLISRTSEQVDQILDLTGMRDMIVEKI